MPGSSQKSFVKPVVVVRRRAGAKSATSTTTQPALPQSPRTRTFSSPQPPSAAPVPKPAPKPTPPEDPAVVAARQAARIAATQVVLKELMDRWPQTFSAHPLPVRPLATGIAQAIAVQLPQVPKSVVHKAIAFWQRQRKTIYLRTLIAGGPRYDLDGNPQGEVTPEQQQQAREALIAWQARRQEKRRAIPQQPPSSSSPADTSTES